MRKLISLLSPVMSVALGFVREHTPESSTRLCAIICCITAREIALGLLAFIRDNPKQAATTAAAAVLCGTFVSGGMVSLLSRTRKPAPAAGGGAS